MIADEPPWRTRALDWTLGRLARARGRIRSVTLLLTYWHSAAVRTAHIDGHREGYLLGRRIEGREARQRSRERAYGLGYRHGRKDSGSLKLVASNPAARPVTQLYDARHRAG